MDSVELLRSYYDDQRAPDADRVDAVRRRLQARYDLEAPPLRARPALTRRRVLTAAGVGVAAVTVGAAVVTGLPGGQSASATELLQRAARHASTSSLAAPGSVTQVRLRGFDLTRAGNGLGRDEVVATRETVTLTRIPADGEPWQRKRWESLYQYAYGDRSKLPASMAVTDPTGTTDAAFERSRSGNFAFGYQPRSDELTLAESYTKIRDLPLDPDALLRVLKADGDGPGAGSAQQVMLSASYVLGRGVASSDLQAAMFQALRQVPDLAVVDEHATDIEGRAGAALGLKPGVADPTGSDSVVQLIIDPITGQYLGSRFVSTRRDGLIPAGAEIGADAVRNDVATTAKDWTPTGKNRWTVYP